MIQTIVTEHGVSNPAGKPEPDRHSAPQSTSPAAADGRRQRPGNRDRRARVSWYGALLIFLMLAIAAGWEIFRLLLLAVTLD
jgi:hypothetical protein